MNTFANVSRNIFKLYNICYIITRNGYRFSVIRLPLVQGGTISFLVPTLAILSLPEWQCPASEIMDDMPHEERTELWQVRMRELSGAIAVSALFQVIVGFGGEQRQIDFSLLLLFTFKSRRSRVCQQASSGTS